MALQSSIIRSEVKKKGEKGGSNPHIAIYGYIFVLMLSFLLGGCGDMGGDPCIQHVGIGGTEPFYYYTGDCGEGVTTGDTIQPSVPHSIHFDNSFLNYNAVKTRY
jgi:hypothetical protein